MGVINTIGRVLKQIAIVVGYILLIGTIVIAILFARHSEQEHRATQAITSFSIHVEGSENHTLIDEASMRAWFRARNIYPEECTLESISLSQLESVALEHSAVASANAYVSHDGALTMNLLQREPLVRLRLDGYNQYIDNEGYVFSATNGYAAYVPVLTGSYHPIFGKEFSGNVAHMVSDSILSIRRLIDRHEQSKYKIYREKIRAYEDYERVQDSVMRCPFWRSNSVVKQRQEELLLFQEAYTNRYKREEAERDRQIEELEREQQRLYEDISLMEKRHADFDRLISFVEWLSSNPQWSGEITQMVITESGDGHILLQVVPRSGDFIIDVGEISDIERKFRSLEQFYSVVLSNVGWQTYNHISVRYDGQVVCRKAPASQRAE